MLVTPRPGADRAALLHQLVQVETDLNNVRGRGTTADDLFNAYLRWVAGAIRVRAPAKSGVRAVTCRFVGL